MIKWLGDRAQQQPDTDLPTQTYVRISVYYLLFYTTVAVFNPYFNLYLSSRGLSGMQVGTVLAVIPMVGIFAQPLWGMLNDRFHVQKTTLLLGLTMSPLILLSFQWIHSLALYMIAAGCLAVFQTGMSPVADAMTVQNTGIQNYGKVRMYGSLGYAVMTALAASIYHRFGFLSMPNVYVLAGLLGLVGLALYPKPPVQSTRGPSPFIGMGKLLRNKRFLKLLLFTLFITTSQALNSNFFSLYYHQLHRPMVWLGITYALGGLSELPFLFLVGKFIGKYGAERAFMLGGAVFVFRWVVLAFAPPTWVIVPLQLLHGISFGFTLAAGVAIATRVSDGTNRMSAQALYSSVNVGVASILGSLLGGFVLTEMGPRGVYGVAAAMGLTGLVLMTWFVQSHSQGPNLLSLRSDRM